VREGSFEVTDSERCVGKEANLGLDGFVRVLRRRHVGAGKGGRGPS
jgi:hypothetical protein